MHLAQLEKDAKAIFVCKGYDTAHHILLTVCTVSQFARVSLACVLL